MPRTTWTRVIGLTMALAFASTVTAWAADPPVPVQSSAPTATDGTTIRQVIGQQIAAFRADDGPGAFAEASPGIRKMFGDDPAAFLSMVKQGYQPVYRPKSVTFGQLEQTSAGLVQHVDVVGPDGTLHTALYSMERQPDGVWRISGCAIVDAAAVGA